MSKLKVAKHTPGPWTVKQNKSGDVTPHIVGNDGKSLGLATGCDLPGQMESNAALIAAAPELKQELQLSQGVLEGLLSYFDPGHERDIIEDQIKRNATAISKADGGK